jgi:hypothetical protein
MSEKMLQILLILVLSEVCNTAIAEPNQANKCSSINRVFAAGPASGRYSSYEKSVVGDLLKEWVDNGQCEYKNKKLFLVFQRSDGSERNLKDAELYCRLKPRVGLEYWRLPTVSELSISYKKGLWLFENENFLNLTGYVWTSSLDGKSPVAAWIGRPQFDSNGRKNESNAQTICVRKS